MFSERRVIKAFPLFHARVSSSLGRSFRLSFSLLLFSSLSAKQAERLVSIFALEKDRKRPFPRLNQPGGPVLFTGNAAFKSQSASQLRRRRCHRHALCRERKADGGRREKEPERSRTSEKGKRETLKARREGTSETRIEMVADSPRFEATDESSFSETTEPLY